MEIVIFYGALFLAYLKTGEALAIFGPKSFLGWEDSFVQFAWGYAAAFLVEGVLAYGYTTLKRRSAGPLAHRMSWAAMGIAVAFSLVMNFVDTAINQNWVTITDTSPLMLGMRLVVVAVPITMAVLFGLIRILDNQGGNQGKQKQRPQQYQQESRHDNGREREIAAPHPSQAHE